MRAAVIYYCDKQTKYLKKTSEALAEELKKNGATVDVFNAKDFNRRLLSYQLVAIGTESTGTFGGGIPSGIDKFLISAGPALNVRSYAFVVKKGMRCNKSLLALMRAMEHEGAFLVCSDVLGTAEEIESAGTMLAGQEQL